MPPPGNLTRSKRISPVHLVKSGALSGTKSLISLALALALAILLSTTTLSSIVHPLSLDLSWRLIASYRSVQCHCIPRRVKAWRGAMSTVVNEMPTDWPLRITPVFSPSPSNVGRARGAAPLYIRLRGAPLPTDFGVVTPIDEELFNIALHGTRILTDVRLDCKRTFGRRAMSFPITRAEGSAR